MKRILLAFTVLVFVSATAQSQAPIYFQNPSLEGLPAEHLVPVPWIGCAGTPDTQPGAWGVTAPASDDTTYVSMIHDGRGASYYKESISQELSTCLQAGTTYSILLDLAHSNIYQTAEPDYCTYSSMEIVGASIGCGTTEVLWQSGMVLDTNWQTYTATFTPSANYCYLTFKPYVIDTCNGFVNILVDNIRPASNTPFYISSPADSSWQSCTFAINGIVDSLGVDSVVLEGSFIGSPIIANITNDSTWEAQLYYSYGYSGWDSVTASAYYPSLTISDFIHVNIGNSLPVPEICLASVDTALEKNVVKWEWPVTTAIDHYVVYKEGNQNGVYGAIGTVTYNSTNLFVDSASIPVQNANRYKLSSVDTCGIESDLSNHHKTIHLSINSGTSSNVNLSWNYYEGDTVISYNIYHGTSLQNLVLLTTLAGSLNSFTDVSPQTGSNYYMVEALLANGCDFGRSFVSSLSNINSVSIVTGADDLKSMDFNVYPNPASNAVSIILPSGIASANYVITNALGQSLVAGNLLSNIESIDISGLASGTYFLQVINGNTSGIKKIMVY